MFTKANMVDDKPIPKWYEKNGNCFVCGKPSHHAPQCKYRAKNDNPSKVDTAKGEYTIIVVVSQVNIVTNVNKLVVDSRATKLICANRNVFTFYTNVGGGEEKVYLDDKQA